MTEKINWQHPRRHESVQPGDKDSKWLGKRQENDEGL